MSVRITPHQTHTQLIEFQRPEKKNAITAAMYQTVAEAINAAQTDDALRSVVITGSGDSFTAGNDLLDFMQAPPTGIESPVFQFLKAIAAAQKPLIAAVNGVAVGVGMTMLFHCDFVYAAPGARLQMPFIDLALVPEAASSLLVPQLLGYQRAAELLLLGEGITAEQAAELGLVNAVREDPLAEALAVAERLAEKPPEALTLTKALMKRSQQRLIEETLLAEGELFLKRLKSPEFFAAAQAFASKKR